MPDFIQSLDLDPLSAFIGFLLGCLVTLSVARFFRIRASQSLENALIEARAQSSASANLAASQKEFFLQCLDQEQARRHLDERAEGLQALLKPLEQTLNVYSARLAESETRQAATLADFRRHIQLLAGQNRELTEETHLLRRILHSSQARGKWGEETLRRVVEAAGLSPHCDFSEQVTCDDARPDLLIKMPDNRTLVVDAKTPDLDELKRLDRADQDIRGRILAAFARRMRSAISALSDRNYPQKVPNAFDYVILFIPAESLFSASLEGDPDLIVWAARRKVLLTTPASLIGLLRVVSLCWRQRELSENGRQIAELGARISRELTDFESSFAELDNSLTALSAVLDKTTARYRGGLRKSAARLRELAGEDNNSTGP